MPLRAQDRVGFVLLFAALAVLINVWQHANAALPIGTSLKEPVGISHWLNSKPISLDALRGKVVAIDFYASGCSNCRAAVPHVVQLYEKYKGRGFVVIGVHTPEGDYERNLDFVRATAKQLGITYPVAVDDSQATWTAYQNQWWPNFLLFDRSGKLVYEHAGEGAYDEIDATVKGLL